MSGPAAAITSATARQTTPLLRAALTYARRGWPVFPCWWPLVDGRCACGARDCASPGKHPLARLAPRGVLDATTDADRVRRWWQRSANANVAVATGPRSGLLVLDVDVRAGGDDSLAELERTHGPIPETPRVQTGAGWHVYFTAPRGEVASRAGVRPGLDARGVGGYVIAPPSRHASGRVYRWELGATPLDLPLAAPPVWLLEVLREERRRLVFDGRPLVIPHGERNARLFQLACALRRYGLAPRALRGCLDAINAAHATPPLPAGEVARIAASACRYVPAGPDVARAADAEKRGEDDEGAPRGSRQVRSAGGHP
jgi:hypothetical protein